MKTQRLKIARLMRSLTAIAIAAIVCPGMSLSAHAAPGKPSQGGGLPYPTASTVRQLIADIDYANQKGGVITINLKPGVTFNLKSVHNTTDGGNGLPVIGGTKPVDLTIIGNGATIQRSAVASAFRLLDVAFGSSLTINQVSLRGGYFGSGAAILNHGTLNLMNGSILSGNTGSSGGGIYNNLGTVTITDSFLSDNYVSYNGGGIYNNGGTVTISSSALYANSARWGGGIYNSGGTVMVIASTLSANEAFHADYPWAGGDGGGIYNASGSVTINNSTLTGNSVGTWSNGDGGFNYGSGGGIYNNGEVIVENYSSITGSTAAIYGIYHVYGADVFNLRLLYLDDTSVIDVVQGNPPILFQ